MYDELVKDLRKKAEFLSFAEPMHIKSVLAETMKQAADAIEELTGFVQEAERDRDEYRERLDKANDAIEALSKKEKTTQWISVAERLPEFDQKVLAWVKNKDQEGRFNKDGIYTAELKDKMPKPDPDGKRNFWGIPGYDSVWTVWSWSYFTEPDVLFWMPIPEPPKEET